MTTQEKLISRNYLRSHSAASVCQSTALTSFLITSKPVYQLQAPSFYIEVGLQLKLVLVINKPKETENQLRQNAQERELKSTHKNDPRCNNYDKHDIK